jgi:hypothetical protein
MSLPTGNHFGDPGALAIAAALRTNETLTALSIFGARLCCLFQIGALGCPHHKTLLGLLCSEFASRIAHTNAFRARSRDSGDQRLVVVRERAQVTKWPTRACRP